MSCIRFRGRCIETRPGETVLAALTREGEDVPSSCGVGACQTCLVRASKGKAPAAAQSGLKESWRVQGYFLACQGVPEGDLDVELPGVEGDAFVRARVVAVDALGPDVARVRLEPERVFAFRPGQFVNVVRSDGLARSYSIASEPAAGATLELHVRILPGGRMSTWLASAAAVGAAVTLRGPSGECFYVEGRPDEPLVLAATGTGLAVLWGVLHDALSHGHCGPITLLHGARNPEGHYLTRELTAVAERHRHVRYERCALEGAGAAADGVAVGALDAILDERFPSLEGHRLFLCGDPAVVARMKRHAFLAGARLTDIHADAFVTAAATGTPLPVSAERRG